MKKTPVHIIILFFIGLFLILLGSTSYGKDLTMKLGGMFSSGFLIVYSSTLVLLLGIYIIITSGLLYLYMDMDVSSIRNIALNHRWKVILILVTTLVIIDYARPHYFIDTSFMYLIYKNPYLMEQVGLAYNLLKYGTGFLFSGILLLSLFGYRYLYVGVIDFILKSLFLFTIIHLIGISFFYFLKYFEIGSPLNLLTEFYPDRYDLKIFIYALIIGFIVSIWKSTNNKLLKKS